VRRPLIAGNWKMYKTVPEATALAGALVDLVRDVRDREVMIAPPFTALAAVAGVLAGSNIRLGGQDVYWEAEGAYTGQISPAMLVSAGCSHVIIGHSERRQYFGETDATVNRKTAAALKAGLAAVVCLGETLGEREENRTLEVVGRQLTEGLRGIGPAGWCLAYEPVWAIGTGRTATPEQAQEVHRFLRGRVEELYGSVLARDVRILYGGSVKPDNMATLMAMEDIDGALVGGASLKAESFAAIVKY
jgi:triosephosphate isomerase